MNVTGGDERAEWHFYFSISRSQRYTTSGNVLFDVYDAVIEISRVDRIDLDTLESTFRRCFLVLFLHSIH